MSVRSPFWSSELHHLRRRCDALAPGSIRIKFQKTYIFVSDERQIKRAQQDARRERDAAEQRYPQQSGGHIHLDPDVSLIPAIQRAGVAGYDEYTPRAIKLAFKILNSELGKGG